MPKVSIVKVDPTKDCIFDYPIIARINWTAVDRYAAKQGWTWRRDSSIYGGYFVDRNGFDNYYIL